MAVYTDISPEQLNHFLSHYDLGIVDKFIGITEGVENSNYRLSTSSGTYILTIYEKRVRKIDLPYYLGLMEHLARSGTPCPTPVIGKNGKSLHNIDSKSAAIFTFLKGSWPLHPSGSHCKELGRALGRMHIMGNSFDLIRENDLGLSGWKKLFNKCKERADQVSSNLANEINDEINFLENNWPSDLPSGIIHADLFPDNVFFTDEKLTGIIDFYFACNDFYSYDIAVCLNAWCFENDGKFNIQKSQYLLKAYNLERKISKQELTYLPLLARGAALRFLLTRLHDWLNQVDGALVRPKDPTEYLHRLRFHQNIKDSKSYGNI